VAAHRASSEPLFTTGSDATAPDSGDLVVRMAGVAVRRGDATLLDGVDWAVELDERWVVLGPNGAGKTTLLRLAAAELHPSAGVEETVRDVVISAGYAVIGRWRERYDPTDTARADDLLGTLGLRGLAARAYGTLSEGERKRALIARALMTDPELLLLDEPAAGLDLGGREDLVARLSALANDADAPASVLVTHHVEEIPPGYSHGLLLRGGRVVAAGLLDDVLSDENLSATFGLPLAVQKRRGRYTAWLR
jgi:iron complex transport system ATP-binding protein